MTAAVVTPPTTGTTSDDVHMTLAAEAHELVKQLQRLAARASGSQVGKQFSQSSHNSTSTSTDIMLEQLVDWEHAGSLLEQAAANTERLQAELALCCTESDAASAAHSRAISDQQKITEDVKRASLENISLSSSRKAETMAREHHMILEEHAANGAKEEAQAVQILISERADTQEAEVATFQQEITVIQARTQRAQDEARQLADSAARAQEAAASAEALQDVAGRVELLDEEHARYQEELGTLRFNLKDSKSFHNRRVQELDAQVQRLERQRRRVESKNAVRVRSETDSTNPVSTESQLQHLQQLNARLTEQVQEAEQERCLIECRKAELTAEHQKLGMQQELETEAVGQKHQELDELAAAEGSSRREARQLRNQAHLKQKHAAVLDETAAQTRLQLEEAEAANGRLEEECQSAKRFQEVLDWKVQLAQSHLLGNPPRTRITRSGRRSESSELHEQRHHQQQQQQQTT
mmetsp:Transcript_124809/g.249222  ORF Transcript_124809/g.249222 Transcript_124809/m.249222 type:complete len:468 (+) Transcript_124809:78-1481(+)